MRLSFVLLRPLGAAADETVMRVGVRLSGDRVGF
jgi:hypothetical protein